VALVLAGLSSLCFGTALITAKFGLRSLDARAGAAISIPSATLLFAIASPFALELSGFALHAALLFALVGLFFPAVVTLLTFESNDRLGPTVTSAVSSTAPLFALVAAALLLGEHIPGRAILATVGVVAGVAVLTWKATDTRAAPFRWALLLPVSGAMLRGTAQVIAKAGLVLWPNPFAAGLIGYVVSSATVLAVDRFPRGSRQRRAKVAIAWFVLTGILNGGAVLLMYAALSVAPVAMVAPVVAAYPLVTVLLSALVLRDESLTLRVVAGATLTVAAIAYLVAG
jgi:drug/metabolite transporter (DMT)-like permease